MKARTRRELCKEEQSGQWWRLNDPEDKVNLRLFFLEVVRNSVAFAGGPTWLLILVPNLLVV